MIKIFPAKEIKVCKECYYCDEDYFYCGHPKLNFAHDIPSTTEIPVWCPLETKEE